MSNSTGNNNNNNTGNQRGGADSGKIPRIELTRERSSTLESIQSLTRAIRESLRLHSVRREKKRRQKKAAKAASGGSGGGAYLDVGPVTTRRIRSKSMDSTLGDEDDDRFEISDAVVSAVVVSDIGAVTECEKALFALNASSSCENAKNSSVANKQQSQQQSQQQTQQQGQSDNDDDVFEDAHAARSDGGSASSNNERRHLKSVDNVESLELISKQKQQQQQQQQQRKQTAPWSLDIVESVESCRRGQHENNNKESDDIRKQTPRQSSMPITTSRDDNTKVDASVLRKRFARLLDTLRSHKFSIGSIEEASSSLSSAKNSTSDQ